MRGIQTRKNNWDNVNDTSINLKKITEMKTQLTWFKLGAVLMVKWWIASLRTTDTKGSIAQDRRVKLISELGDCGDLQLE